MTTSNCTQTKTDFRSFIDKATHYESVERIAPSFAYPKLAQYTYCNAAALLPKLNQCKSDSKQLSMLGRIKQCLQYYKGDCQKCALVMQEFSKLYCRTPEEIEEINEKYYSGLYR
jgi:hypothetical protein